VVQFGPLGATLLGQVQSQPGSIPAILQHVGPLPILDWTRHFLTLGAPSIETTGYLHACLGLLRLMQSLMQDRGPWVRLHLLGVLLVQELVKLLCE
jgi:hypothetical protein